MIGENVVDKGRSQQSIRWILEDAISLLSEVGILVDDVGSSLLASMKPVLTCFAFHYQLGEPFQVDYVNITIPIFYVFRI